MSRLIVFLACGLVACSVRTRPRATGGTEETGGPADPVSAIHATIDLTGSWATGSGLEPTARTIVVHPPCNYSPGFLMIYQKGDSVRAWIVPESRAHGIRSPEPSPEITATGRLSGASVTLELGNAYYVLRYDSMSGHLRGTRNGAPFWAVREEIVRPEGCVPPP